MSKITVQAVDFPIVKSMDNLVVGRTYQTTEYSIFKHLKFNRGAKEGYVRARVNKIKKLIGRKKFYFHVTHVMVNLYREVIDGNNRLQALIELGMPVNFEITAQPEFNIRGKNATSEILNNVSDYNSMNSSWGQKDAFLSAFSTLAPAAVIIDQIKTEIENEYGLPNTMFTPSRLVALANREATGLAGKAQVRRAYCSEETAEKLQSPEFKKELEYIIKMIMFVQVNNNNLREWFVVRNILPTVWKNELSLRIVLSNMKKRGFKKLSGSDMSAIKARATEILKMGNV